MFHACSCDPERLERCAQEKMERCAHEMVRHRRSSQQYVKRDRQPLEIVRKLLAAGARVGGADSKGECALMSVEEDVERVRILVGAGADVNQADEVGRSVLMRCMKGQVGNVMDVVGHLGVPSFDGPESEEEWTRATVASVEASWGKHLEVNPEPYTLNPQPSSLNPEP